MVVEYVDTRHCPVAKNVFNYMNELRRRHTEYDGSSSWQRLTCAVMHMNGENPFPYTK